MINGGFTVNNIETKILGGLVGFAIGDALGVPIEFTPRKKDNPLTEMVGFGSHSVPAGTWSDDTSMVIAGMDSLSKTNAKADYDDIMKKGHCVYESSKYLIYTLKEKLMVVKIIRKMRDSMNAIILEKLK